MSQVEGKTAGQNFDSGLSSVGDKGNMQAICFANAHLDIRGIVLKKDLLW